MTYKKKILFALFIVITLLTVNFGCKKLITSEEPIEKNEVRKTLSKKSSKEYLENKRYLNDRLDKLAKIITQLSRYKEVRTIVNEQVDKKFDGDYNVLLKDLVNALKKIPSSQKPTKLSSISGTGRKVSDLGDNGPEPMSFDPTILEGLIEQVSIPIIIDGYTLDPQIYIPFYGTDALQPVDVSPCSIPSYDTNTYLYPIVIPYDGDESSNQDVFTGSTYDSMGYPMNVQVSECFATTHTIWAVTINESNPHDNTPYSGAAASPSDTIAQAAHIKSMVVKVDKESWLKGANEVEISYSMSWANGINPANNQYKYNLLEIKIPKGSDAYGLPQFDYLFEISLGKFTNREIKNQFSDIIDQYYFIAGSPTKANGSKVSGLASNRDWYPTKGTYIYYTIFERDWPFGSETVDVPLVTTVGSQGNTSVLVAYNSYNSPYISGSIRIVPNNYAPFIETNITKSIILENDQIRVLGSYSKL